MPVSPSPPEPGPIAGTVLDAQGGPLPGQVVAIGAEKTTSDGYGRFAFPRVPAGYDLVIASPDGSRATVYQGLTRRDPAVRHDGARPGEPAHRAEISVTLSGADASEMAAERWQVHFVSERAFAAIPGKGGWSAGPGGLVSPTPLTVSWDGDDTIDGTVVAFSMRTRPSLSSPAAHAEMP